MTGGPGPGEPEYVVDARGSQGVQTGKRSKQVNKFIRTYVENLLVEAPLESVAGPVVAGGVPQKPLAFVPRAGLLATLATRGPDASVVQVVTGMRGAGKTQLVAAYARSRINEGWRLVAWVNAGDTAKVLNGLAEVAARLGIGEPGEDLESLSAAVRYRMEADGERCLVVFDNVAELDTLRPFLPAAGQSQVVITSIHQQTAGLGAVVPVGVFSEPEALSFLTGRTGRTDTEGSRELAQELGYLPLALAQAAAVIAAQSLDYQTYLGRLRALPVNEYLTRAEGEPYPEGAAEAVLLSLNAVAVGDSRGLCSILMDVVSVLSTTGTPRALLRAAGDAGMLLDDEGDDSSVSSQTVDEALGRLGGASLLTFSVDGASVSAHRLIMRVLRERRAHVGGLPAVGAKATVMLQAMSESIDPVWQNRPAARDLVQQVLALHEHMAPHVGDDDTGVMDILELRGWAMWCLNRLGDSPAQAVKHGEPLVADRERVLGEDHPDTLWAQNELAAAYQAAGQLDRAITLNERTLAARERTLGEDHPKTLMSRSNLAAAYQAAGQLGRAITLNERTLAARERTLGEDHPDTLTTRNNLAAAYQDARQPDRAITLDERTLAARERTLGEDHPDTLKSRNNLAIAYEKAGLQDRAIRLLERTLADRERILGDTHPETLTVRDNLVTLYQRAGRPDAAIRLLERTLAARERTHEEDHRDTLTTRRDLALIYYEAGLRDRAIPLLERVLADDERILGADHPDTLTARHDLSYAYQETGQPDRAIPLLERAIADDERILGADHPDTLTARNNLTHAYKAAKRSRRRWAKNRKRDR